MHLDRDLLLARIDRELVERVLPLVEADQQQLVLTAGPTIEDQTPFEVGSRWGSPWATTWFVLRGEIPDSWAGKRVEAVIDLGFEGQPGFQSEGMVVDASGHPVQGLHPYRRNVAVDSTPGPFTIRIEAASNPSFHPRFLPSPQGDPATATDELLYTLRRAAIVLVDTDAEALAHDVDVLFGVINSLDRTDPRFDRLLVTVTAALDLLPDVAAARAVLAPALSRSTNGSGHQIVAVGHAHIDTAWLWPMRETIRKCTRTFASAVGLMDDYPEYLFACSQAQQYAWIEERQPELFDKIRAKVAGGQWIPVGGMWVEADMNLPSGESLARQFVYGQRYFGQRFGVRCTEVWIPDVFGYPASMPELYAAAGLRRFVTQKLSWNVTNRFPHHTFWWEGLDGSRVLTHFPPVDTYNAEITPGECVASVARFREHAWSDWSLMPFGYGDGGGGPTREMLERARRMADLDGAPQVHIGSVGDFFDRVEAEAESGAPIPIWRGELYFETHRGTFTSQLATKDGNRRCERLLREVELWSATLGTYDPSLEDLWRTLLTQQFHDIIPGSSIAWVHDDAEAILADVATQLEERLVETFNALVPSSPHVANASPFARDELIELDGEMVRVRVDGHAISPVAPIALDDEVVVSDYAMSNGHLAVRWDETGAITSLIAIDFGREIVPVGAALAAIELAPDRPVRYDAWDVESWTPALGQRLYQPASIRVESIGPAVGRVSVHYAFEPSSLTVTYVLRAGSKRLDIEIDIDWHHREHLLSIALPLDVRAESAACDIQFGHVMRPTHPSTSWDAAKFEVCAHRFVDLAEPTFGVAVLNNGRYGHRLFGGGVNVSLARGAMYPDPGADEGRHRVTLAVFPHGSGLADVLVEAERLNVPLRNVTGKRAAAETSNALAPVVSIDGIGVRVDAVKLADDGSGDLIVRCHEARGARTTLIAKTATDVLAAARCNLLEETLEPVETNADRVSVELRPFEILTLRLSRS